jgi:hypothetical protein
MFIQSVREIKMGCCKSSGMMEYWNIGIMLKKWIPGQARNDKKIY